MHPALHHTHRVTPLPELQDSAAEAASELSLKERTVASLNGRVEELQAQLEQQIADAAAAAAAADASAQTAYADHVTTVTMLQLETAALVQQQQASALQPRAPQPFVSYPPQMLNSELESARSKFDLTQARRLSNQLPLPLTSLPGFTRCSQRHCRCPRMLVRSAAGMSHVTKPLRQHVTLFTGRRCVTRKLQRKPGARHQRQRQRTSGEFHGRDSHRTRFPCCSCVTRVRLFTSRLRRPFPWLSS